MIPAPTMTTSVSKTDSLLFLALCSNILMDRFLSSFKPFVSKGIVSVYFDVFIFSTTSFESEIIAI